jgi:prolyl-tRNA editing enzyme YbaK/EbsC (Cys-tRNA(Pro) deacylase)
MQRANVHLREEQVIRHRGADAPSAVAAVRPPIPPVFSVDGFLQAQSIGYRHIWRGAHSLSDDGIARNVLLVDGRHHALALIPQSRLIDIAAINHDAHRHFHLGGVADVVRLYPGLAPQVLWPAGIAARIEIFVDEALVRLDEVAFDTRDPRCLTVIAGEDFRRIFRTARRAGISRRF